MRMPGIREIRKENDEYFLHFAEKAHTVNGMKMWHDWNVMGKPGQLVQAECPYVGERGSSELHRVKSHFFSELTEMRNKASDVEVTEEMSAKQLDIICREAGGLAWQEISKKEEVRPGLTWYPGDWPCLECTFINYGTRKTCSYCERKDRKTERPPRKYKSEDDAEWKEGKIGRNQVPADELRSDAGTSHGWEKADVYEEDDEMEGDGVYRGGSQSSRARDSYYGTPPSHDGSHASKRND